MRVGHVVRQYLPSRGGMEEVVFNLCREQQEIGWKPGVVTLNRLFADPTTVLTPEETLNGIKVARLAYTGSRRYPFAPQVLSLVAQYDVVHVHGIDFFFDYLAATTQVHRRPLVATTH